ncbi:hypothetical protein [Psychroserpens sp.]|uniref:hypothetical protein n=1 Tax=Psychroserpens sp. TaxID=2020870 RepID=UPI003859D726
MKKFKLKDYLISFLIVAVTLLYFCDKYLGLEGVESVSIFSFDIGSFGFPDFRQLFFYSKMKLLILFITITWYLTCKHWWKSSILVIITIELLKLVTALKANSEFYDEIDYLISLPITLPIILLLVLVSLKINKYNLTRDLRSNIDEEIDEVFFELHSIDKTQLDFLKDKFLKIKNEKKTGSYLEELKSIRDKFYDIC